MNETPGTRQASSPQSGLYTTIALYAAANALSLAVFLIIYHVSAVLADFRDPMLYAFLCSIALRGPKDWLVDHMDWHLRQDRSLIVASLTAIAPPYITLQFIWAEVKDAAKVFRGKVKEVRDEYQRNMDRGRSKGNGGAVKYAEGGASLQQHNGEAAAAGGSPRHPATAGQRHIHQPYALTVYAKAVLRTFTSRKEPKKRRKRAASALRKQSPSPASNKLLATLVILTIAWALIEWIRDSWSRTAHATIMTGITLVLSTLIFRSIWNKAAAMTSTSVSSPFKTPASAAAAAASAGVVSGSGARGRGGGGGGAGNSSPRISPWTVTAPGFKQPNFHGNNPHTSFSDNHGTATPRSNIVTPPSEDLSFGRYLRHTESLYKSIATAITKGSKVLGVIESPIRAFLRGKLHAIVTALLIFGLIIGTMSATAFFTVRIIGEARGVLIAARDAFPAAWPSISAATPMLADELTDVDSSSSTSSSTRSMLDGKQIPLLSLQQQQNLKNLQQVASGVPLPLWLQAYREDAVSLAQRSLPGMASWLEERIYGLVRDHNLTDTLWDARLLYEAAQGPRVCSDRERSKMLVTLAKAEVKARKARDEEERAGRYAGDAQRKLVEAVAALSSAMDRGGGKKGKDSASNTETEDPSSSTIKSLAELQECVVSADAALLAAKESHKSAAAALDDAERSRRVADGRSQLCINGDAVNAFGGSSSSSSHLLRKNSTNGSQVISHQGGLLSGLTDRLSSAYNKIFREWRAGEGISELYKAILYGINGIRQRSGGSTTTAADLTRLQRLVQAAAVPLISLGKAAAASVGTTTAAAVMGSLGLFRLGLGVVHIGVQAALFLTLLYYLLAAKTDPLARAVALLPLPPAARLRAATALNAALGGVFMSMLKLAAFHGLFAWITFRIFGAPLAYTTSVASAAFALLPFVPTYSVALPGCAVVALQGRVISGVTLIILHFLAYYVGDTVVLEDSGGHPFMMSLAILGGLWTFSNPLLGCLLGPTLLSLLSAMGTLHTELMGGSSSGTGGATTGGGGAAPGAVLLSPAASGSLFELPFPVLTTPEGVQVVPAHAIMPKLSPRSTTTSPAKYPEGKSTAPVPAAVAPTESSMSLTDLAEDHYKPGESADNVDGEIQSELLGGQENGGGGSSGGLKKSGFTFRRKKQSVNFDISN
jgi:predicted PurR-regulated permease PerM